ncbi:50S ribosomal protein L35 [Candidatus Uhrbacteria bacterium]|nr:50S ribosomal protein L35 [Candidatus Uhrbacteria bacterium]
MPKLKTHKATAKRLVLTRRGKVLKRKSGQDHFNSRESSSTRMGKRRDIAFDPLLVQTAKRAMPYS